MKTLKYTLLAAVSIFVAASCTKESTGDIQPSEGVDVKAVFEAVAEDDMSKALLQSNGGLQWENGDQIAVYQYGNYATGTPRDKSKNIFISDGTCRFSGTIAGYKPLGEGGATNRYYAAFPASRCNSFGYSTGQYTISIPEQQTGNFVDFDNYAMYLGYLRPSKEEDIVSYDESTQTLTFIESFKMLCITPVLKFRVPESLNVSRIVLSAKNADGNDVNLAGKTSKNRIDAAYTPAVSTSSSEIIIDNNGEILSGDVYAVLSPDTCTKPSGSSTSLFKSSAKTLTLNLSTPQGATASLQMTLTGEILAGTIKNLPALPTSVNWILPAGPGISAIENNKTSITLEDNTTLSAKSRILLTPENPESVIKYKIRSSLAEAMETTPSHICDAAGIKRQDAATPDNYLNLRVSTEGYADYNAYACTWILYKQYGFGAAFTAASSSLTPEVGSTFPADGSYLYNLSFEYETIGTTSNIPHISSDGFYLIPSNNNEKYCSGKLHIKAPGTGKARLFFDCALTTNSRTITVTRGDETIDSIATGDKADYDSPYRVVSSEVFDVSADDVLTVSVSGYIIFYSMTLLWEPEVTEASLATESYAAKTSYGN